MSGLREWLLDFRRRHEKARSGQLGAAELEAYRAARDELARGIRKDKRFVMPGFGTFAVKKRAGRVGRNPRTGAEIQIAPTRTVNFKPAPELKKAL